MALVSTRSSVTVVQCGEFAVVVHVTARERCLIDGWSVYIHPKDGVVAFDPECREALLKGTPAVLVDYDRHTAQFGAQSWHRYWARRYLTLPTRLWKIIIRRPIVATVVGKRQVLMVPEARFDTVRETSDRPLLGRVLDVLGGWVKFFPKEVLCRKNF